MTSNLLNTQDATNALSSMLVDAYLDEIRAHSIQATLRFFSDHVRLGARTAVDIVFVCNASVLPDGFSRDEIQNDFFVERARFLSFAHNLIGKNIISVNLSDEGTLMLITDTSSILLSLSKEDLTDDDWAWKVELEENINILNSNMGALYCSAEDGYVRFYSGDR
jgi:hypothetical protein